MDNSNRVQQTRSNPNSNVAPEEDENLIVVLAISFPLEVPIATIVVRSGFETRYPGLLQGSIDPQTYANTIGVINWFMMERLIARSEFLSSNPELTQAWNKLHDKYTISSHRDTIIKAYCELNKLEPPRYRDFVFEKSKYEASENKVFNALKLFLEDQNQKIYKPNGWYWRTPSNGWLWLELSRLKTTSHMESENPPKLHVPISIVPKWGENIEFDLINTVHIGKHTEYMIRVTTDLEKWSPTSSRIVLKRYTDFEELRQSLKHHIKSQKLDIKLPKIPEKDYLTGNRKSVVEKRAPAFLEFLRAIVQHPELQSCSIMLQFFEVYHDPFAWMGLPYLRLCFSESSL